MTFDQGEVQFYFNGEADGMATLATTSLAHVFAPIQIGSANGNSFFQGDIDEVGIWSRALEATEIQALHLDGESAVDPTPSGCELFSIQTLAMQNLILLDSIATLNAALANASNSAPEGDSNEWPDEPNPEDCLTLVEHHLSVNCLDFTPPADASFVDEGCAGTWVNAGCDTAWHLVDNQPPVLDPDYVPFLEAPCSEIILEAQALDPNILTPPFLMTVPVN